MNCGQSSNCFSSDDQSFLQWGSLDITSTTAKLYPSLQPHEGPPGVPVSGEAASLPGPSSVHLEAPDSPRLPPRFVDGRVEAVFISP